MNTPEAVATALNYVGQTWLASYVVSIGASIALISTLIVFMLGQPRIIFSMSRDGFLPKGLSKVHPKYNTPYLPTIISGAVIMFLAGVCDLTNVAALCNIGTLFTFIMVCAGVIILRYKYPDMHRPFKVPFVPYVPILGILICLSLVASLPRAAWIGFFVWFIIGLIIYFSYGRKNTYYAADKKKNNAVINKNN